MSMQQPPQPSGPYDSRQLPGGSGPYKFSSDELRVLKECNKESFYQRCLPMSGLLGLSTYYGIKTGYLRPSARFGVIPKVSVAVIVGYFLGKFSYQRKCAEKLMSLPNSQVGEMLRKRRNKSLQESFEPGFGPAMSLPSLGGMSSTESYTDLDASPPHFEGLNDSQRPSLDNTVVYEEEEMPPQQKHTVTYEELRKQNREDYQNKQRGLGRSSSRPIAEPSRSVNDDLSAHVHKNKYGDAME